MPTLILPGRYTPDSIALWRAAVAAGWSVERIHGWTVPESLLGKPAAVYGETIFCRVMAEALSLTLVEPPLDWLATLPAEWRRRAVELMELHRARGRAGPLFAKPADDKLFPARVYDSGAELPAPDSVPDDTPVLLSEPVTWELEFRYFVQDRRVMALFVPARGRPANQGS